MTAPVDATARATPISFTLAAHGAADGATWHALARRAEDLGYTALALPDHRGAQFSPIPALAAAAAVTSTLRVATLVLAAGVRHPVLTAEELATLDVLSGGRLDWGMGAGWLPDDFAPLGRDLAPPGERVRTLIEAVDDLLARFASADERQTLAPVQRPHPPLTIGCAQERLVRHAAAVADVVHCSPLPASRQFGPHPPSRSVTDAFDAQRSWIDAAAASRPTPPRVAVTALPARVTDDVAGAAVQIAGPTGLTPEEVVRSPHVLLGSVESIAETIVQRRERWGITTWVIPDPSLEAFAPVIARVRDAYGA